MPVTLLQSSFRMSRRKGVRLEFTLHEDGLCYLPPRDAVKLTPKENSQTWHR